MENKGIKELEQFLKTVGKDTTGYKEAKKIVFDFSKEKSSIYIEKYLQYIMRGLTLASKDRTWLQFQKLFLEALSEKIPHSQNQEVGKNESNSRTKQNKAKEKTKRKKVRAAGEKTKATT